MRSVGRGSGATASLCQSRSFVSFQHSGWSGSAHEWQSRGKDPASVSGMPRLLAESGSRGMNARGKQGSALPSVVSESGSALLVFHTDGSIARPGGFLLRWTLQQLQPPERPAAPECPAEFVTMDSLLVRWVAPPSSLPLLGYLLEYISLDLPGSAAGGTDIPGTGTEAEAGAEADAEAGANGPALMRAVLPSSQLELRLSGLAKNTTYSFRVQAWTTADVTPGACAGGESSLCSQWSHRTNTTTQPAGEVWHVSASGSYLYGDGSARNPYPMDIQGLIDRADVANGHEIRLHPGTYGTALLRGPGSAQVLNLHFLLLAMAVLTTTYYYLLLLTTTYYYLLLLTSGAPPARLLHASCRCKRWHGQMGALQM